MKANLTDNQILDLTSDAGQYVKCGFRPHEAIDKVCEYYFRCSDYDEIKRRVAGYLRLSFYF